MNKRTALKIARNRCSIFKNGHFGWTLSIPWKSTNLYGPCTHIQAVDYSSARRKLALYVADLAMEQILEGEDYYIREEAFQVMQYSCENAGKVTACGLLTTGLDAAKKFKEKYEV